MITATHDLHGLMLIGLDKDRNLGSIKDCYLDGAVRNITAVLFRTEGLLNRRYLVVPQTRVQVMGVDAWLVTGDNPVLELGELDPAQEMVAAGDLQGRDIATEGGT